MIINSIGFEFSRSLDLSILLIFVFVLCGRFLNIGLMTVSYDRRTSYNLT